MLTTAAIASAIAAAAIPLRAQQTVVPSSCTSIQNVPFTGGIEFGAAIQNVFSNFSGMGQGCADCHFSVNDGTPAGNLDLTPGVSWGNIVNRTSTNGNDIYVVPFHPEQSLLFQAINCDVQAVGDRMPLGGYAGGLTAEQQALVYDWILSGAPVTTTDSVFIGNFEVRGFDQ